MPPLPGADERAYTVSSPSRGRVSARLASWKLERLARAKSLLFTVGGMVLSSEQTRPGACSVSVLLNCGSRQTAIRLSAWRNIDLVI